MRKKENKEAKAVAISHGGNKAKCGYKLCQINFPKLPRDRCNACDKYFHTTCFWKMHVATSIDDKELARLSESAKKQKK